MRARKEILVRLRQIVETMGNLPKIPDVVTDVMDMIESPDASLEDVSEVIGRDPGLSAKLLAIANSPHYGMSHAIGTLNLALVVLGLNELYNIVLGVTLMDTVEDKDIERKMQDEGIWTDSLLAAGVARRLGSYFELSSHGEDFIAGLLHGIGKMVLWKQMPEVYGEICASAAGDKVALARIESERLGFDHADVAAALTHSWKLPLSLVDALQCCLPRSDRNLTDAAVPRIAALARVAALTAREEWGPELPAEPPESAIDPVAWSIILKKHPAMSVPERTKMLHSIVAGLKETPSFIV